MAKILSGIQPSGDLHIGNFFGMMKSMIEYQKSHELYCFIVNYHALTTVHDGSKLGKGTLDAAMDFLSLGLDPKKSIFWIQSDIPEVLELTWILSTITSMGLLERAHSYKDKIAQGLSPNHGLFAYPVLMAADILLFQAEVIPVGKDQKQHIEMTRDIAISFNHQYGETFTLPEPQINEDLSVIPGVDGRKMSKSYDNTIPIFLPEKQLRKRIMSIQTDSTPMAEPKDPNKCNVFSLFKLFASPKEIALLAENYARGGYGYGDAKKELFEKINEFFAVYREKRESLNNDRDLVLDILKEGATKARTKAAKTLELVREKTGLAYQRLSRPR
jgi:tryptophanyl-tRNA synthetase